jgi:multiple sugar transport system substrate-binding protein
MFLPFPKGVAEDAEPRTPSAIGILALSKSTKHPQEAYELAKFMSWSKEGNLAKVRIHEEMNERLMKFPVSDFDEVWAEIEKTYINSDSALYVEGFDLIMYTLPENREAIMDFGKWLPGYNEFKNWYTHVQSESRRQDVANGLIQFADVALVWENEVNSLVTSKLDLYANYPDLAS